VRHGAFGSALKTFQGGGRAVTRQPGLGASNVGGSVSAAANTLKPLIFNIGGGLARRLLKGW
jgi:hypothetical protein